MAFPTLTLPDGTTSSVNPAYVLSVTAATGTPPAQSKIVYLYEDTAATLYCQEPVAAVLAQLNS